MTVDFLEKRQQQYRSAAIACKKRNDIEEAKRYLKLCKGFDPMIAAAKLGKPVDLAQIPPDLSGKDCNYMLFKLKSIIFVSVSKAHKCNILFYR